MFDSARRYRITAFASHISVGIGTSFLALNVLKATRSEVQIANISDRFVWVCMMLGVAAGIFSYSLRSAYVRRDASHRFAFSLPNPTPRRSWMATLAILSCFGLAFSLNALIVSTTSLNALNKSWMTLRYLERTKTDAESILLLNDPAVAKSRYQKCLGNAMTLGLFDMPVPVSSHAPLEKNLKRLIEWVAVNQQIQRRTGDQLQGRLRISAYEIGGLFLFAVAIFLLAMSLAKRGDAQQRRLEETARQLDRSYQDYKDLVGQLPVGIFTIEAGVVALTNRTWDDHFGRSGKLSPRVALERAIWADDQANFFQNLDRACMSGAELDQIVRAIGSRGEVRYFRIRVIAVASQDDTPHLLGFSLDVTAEQLATNRLIQKSSEIELKNGLLREAFGEIEENLIAFVYALVRAVEAKDPYTAGHSVRVMSYAVRMGEKLGLTGSQLRTLEIGALVHDVGKIGIPEHILVKPGPLTEEEFEIIRSHPSLGGKMLANVPMFDEAIAIVQDHHERIDGSGYPRGLKGKQLSLLVQISSVADSFDAMTSNRAYRHGMPGEKALSILRKDAESGAFDIQIVNALADIVKRDGVIAPSIQDEDRPIAA